MEWTIILEDGNYKDLKTVSDSKGQYVSSTNEQSDQSNMCANVFNLKKNKTKQIFARQPIYKTDLLNCSICDEY